MDNNVTEKLPSLEGAGTLEVAEAIAEVLDSKKGRDIKIIHVEEKTVIAEYFVICTGNSSTQVKALVGETHTTVVRRNAVERFDVAAVGNPLLAQAWNALIDVDFLGRVGVRPAGVVYKHRVVWCLDACATFVANVGRQIDFAHTHLDWEQRTVEIYFLRRGI